MTFHKTWLLLLFAICSVPAYAQNPLPSFKKVIVVVLENTAYSTALAQPFLASLAKRGAVFKNFMAEAHPSQPNYIAMIAGDTMGVRDDASVSLKGEHLGNLLQKKGLGWKVYAEGFPGNCFQGDFQEKYARKHVPFLSFENVLKDPVACANIVDASQFQNDVLTSRLQAYSLYIPNLNNDGHDTTPGFADRWLAKEFGPKISDPKFLKDTLLVVTFDESLSYSGPNQILTLFLGDGVVPGSVVTTKTTHYDVLRTIEDTFHLGNLGRGDQAAHSITGIWK
jgi:hypothetical protein